MIFYKFYIGDYQRDTNRLNMTEHGAYRLLLDEYYSLERPLPLCRKLLYKICHVTKRSDKAAVDFVVDNYFVAHEDGFHHKRADIELESAQKKIEKLRLSASLGGKKSAQKRNAANELETQQKAQPDAGLRANRSPKESEKFQANATPNAQANGQANFNPSQNQIQNQIQAISIDKLDNDASPGDAPVTHAQARARSAHETEQHHASLADPGICFDSLIATKKPTYQPPPPSTFDQACSSAPVEKPSKAKRTSRQLASANDTLPHWWPADAWRAYCEFRRTRTSSALEPRVESLARQDLMRLQANGHDPLEVLKQSLRNGWCRLYPVGPSPRRLAREVFATDTIASEVDDADDDGWPPRTVPKHTHSSANGFRANSGSGWRSSRPYQSEAYYERPARVTGLHSGFADIDYTAGISEEGWLL